MALDGRNLSLRLPRCAAVFGRRFFPLEVLSGLSTLSPYVSSCEVVSGSSSEMMLWTLCVIQAGVASTVGELRACCLARTLLFVAPALVAEASFFAGSGFVLAAVTTVSLGVLLAAAAGCAGFALDGRVLKENEAEDLPRLSAVSREFIFEVAARFEGRALVGLRVFCFTTVFLFLGNFLRVTLLFFCFEDAPWLAPVALLIPFPSFRPSCRPGTCCLRSADTGSSEPQPFKASVEPDSFKPLVVRVASISRCRTRLNR